jgi:bis(5'-nucleosidyl)-tetraphosphatase
MKETSAGIIVYFFENDIPTYLILHYEEQHWDLPKGHVEEGETHEQAALRETKEETGFDVELKPKFKESFSYFYTSRKGELMDKTVYFFLGEAKTKEVTLSFEHIGYEWLSYEAASG